MTHSNKSNPWDKELANQINLDNLDGDEIIEMLNNSIDRGRTESKLATDNVNEALLRLKLTRNGKPINAAGILFCAVNERSRVICDEAYEHFKRIYPDQDHFLLHFFT